MSQFTSESIKKQMAEYDTVVRNAVNVGNLSIVIELENEIVSDMLSFYLLNNKFPT